MTRAVRIVIGGSATGLLLGGVAFGVVMWRVHQSVREYCGVAQQRHPHPGDDVAALIDFVNSNAHSIRERDLAVWTLGRLSAPKALPTLEAVYTGDPCKHGISLCQYELEKAIKRCGGIPNPPCKTKH